MSFGDFSFDSNSYKRKDQDDYVVVLILSFHLYFIISIIVHAKNTMHTGFRHTFITTI